MTWFIGIWCLTAAVAIGWLLWGLHKAGQATLDRHIDTALAMARDRHPATRAERISRVVVWPEMTTPTTWASCLWCPFTYDDTQPNELRDHLDSHIRSLRNELQVAATRHREMSEQLRTAGEALVGAGRELLDGAS